MISIGDQALEECGEGAHFFVRQVKVHDPEVGSLTNGRESVMLHPCRIEKRDGSQNPALRWTLLKNRDRLSAASRAGLDALLAQAASKRTARAWLYREHLRAVLGRKQINVVSAMLRQWCTNVMRSRAAPMKDVARMIRKHFDGIVAWTQTRQTNGFIEALNGLFQAAKRKARGYTRFATMRTVIFLIAGKLDFTPVNLYAA
jgi:transposase